LLARLAYREEGTGGPGKFELVAGDLAPASHGRFDQGDRRDRGDCHDEGPGLSDAVGHRYCLLEGDWVLADRGSQTYERDRTQSMRR
jgi:hypothetical protein